MNELLLIVAAMLLGIGTAVWLQRLTVALPPPNQGEDDASDLFAKQATLQASISLLRDLIEQQSRQHPTEHAHQLQQASSEGELARQALHRLPSTLSAGYGDLPGKAHIFMLLQGFAVTALLMAVWLWAGQYRALMQPTVTQAAAVSGDATVVSRHNDKSDLLALTVRVSRNPNDIDLLSQLTQRLLLANMLDEAQTIQQRLQALQPNHLPGQVYALMLQAQRREHRHEAIQQLAHLCLKHPDLAEAWLFRGFLLFQSQQFDAARQALQHFASLAKQPEDKQLASYYLNMLPKD